MRLPRIRGRAWVVPLGPQARGASLLPLTELEDKKSHGIQGQLFIGGQILLAGSLVYPSAGWAWLITGLALSRGTWRLNPFQGLR